MILRGAIFVLLALVSLAFCAEDFYKVRQASFFSLSINYANELGLASGSRQICHRQATQVCVSPALQEVPSRQEPVRNPLTSSLSFPNVD